MFEFFAIFVSNFNVFVEDIISMKPVTRKNNPAESKGQEGFVVQVRLFTPLSTASFFMKVSTWSDFPYVILVVIF